MLVLPGTYRAATHAAISGQRSADIDFGAVVVPAADAERRTAGKFLARLLAHQVDGRAGIAHAGQQAGGTLEHFDAVVDRGIAERIARGIGRVARHRNTVVLEVLHGKTTCVVLGALTVVGDDADARGHPHHVIDAVQAEVIHLRTGDHADGLRGLPRRQYQAGSGGDGARRVGAAAFGDGAQLVGGDLHGLQGLRGRPALFFSRCGLRRGGAGSGH